MFITADEWQRLLAADRETLDDDERYTLEAVTHEMFHIIQLSVTGYAYDVGSELFRIVATALKAHSELEDLFEHRGEYTADTARVLSTLYRTGLHDVTPLSLLEGLA